MINEEADEYGVPYDYSDIIERMNLEKLKDLDGLNKAITKLLRYLSDTKRPPIITQKFFGTMMEERGKIYRNMFLKFI